MASAVLAPPAPATSSRTTRTSSALPRRALGYRFDEVAFPRGNAPKIVNWVDYAATVEHASTRSFVKLVEVHPPGPRTRSGTSGRRVT